MIEGIAAVVGSVVLFLGLTLATIGLVGLFRYRDLFEQLHAAGLITGPGAMLVLIAALASGSAAIITSAVLVVAFILVTASLSTHVIALAAWRERTAMGRDRARAGGPAASGIQAPMRLVVAADGTAASNLAVDLAATIRWPGGSRVHIVGVTEGDLPSPAEPDLAADAGQPTTQEAPSPAVTAVELAAERLRRAGVEAVPAVRGGDPADTIVDEVEAIDADLVIVGTRDQGRVRSLLVGSVAAGVLDRAPCPVLVARRPVLRSVLLATDGTSVSDAAIEAVASWAMFDDADVQVLSVAALSPHDHELPPMRTMREASQRSRHRSHADDAVRVLQAAGRRAVGTVRPGEPAATIAAVAETASIDLIVLGSRGRTGLRRTLLGSVARDVVSATSASVLVVRQRR
jgi:monovalent cation/proton antiporter MnhG/PhaG subunit